MSHFLIKDYFNENSNEKLKFIKVSPKIISPTSEEGKMAKQLCTTLQNYFGIEQEWRNFLYDKMSMPMTFKEKIPCGSPILNEYELNPRSVLLYPSISADYLEKYAFCPRTGEKLSCDGKNNDVVLSKQLKSIFKNRCSQLK